MTKSVFTKTVVAHCVFFCILLQMIVGSALADGCISETYKYAWSENSGWQNFRPAFGEVAIHETWLSGYAWSANIGWIKLGSGSGPYDNTSRLNWGVNLDDGTGSLYGYAWSENAGWINFKPKYGGVKIDPSTLKFDGYAWAQNVGWIHFQNADPSYHVLQKGIFIFINEVDNTCNGNTPCFRTIQEGLNTATDSSCILIAGGYYDGPIVLNSPITVTIKGGWDKTFAVQTPNTTFIKAPSAPVGTLTLHTITITP